MKTLTYKTIRRTTFAIYVLMAIIFWGALIYIGHKEIQQTSIYAQNEKRYLNALLVTQQALNRIQGDFIDLNHRPTEHNMSALVAATANFRLATTKLIHVENKRLNSSLFSSKTIMENALHLFCIANAIGIDSVHPALDGRQLYDDNITAFSNTLSKVRGNIQSLLRTELDHVEIWQRQNFFFIQRLQYILVVFFIITIFFSVAASLLFSYFLKSSLLKLSNGTRAISSGKLDFRFRENHSDEVGNVMNDFNHMAHQLKAQRERLYKTNRELHKQAEKLIEAHQHKDRFLANMSHELRTPLNSVIGFAELIIQRSNSLSPDKSAKYGQRILSASEHLLELISDLLQVAKIDAGVLEPVFAEFNVYKCLEEVISMLQPLADKKQLIMKTECPPDLNFLADKRLIRQILINIIGNAVKFTHHGEISVTVKDSSDNLTIAIKDTGIGISKQEQKNIFKDFHRVENGLTSNYEGVGIGLTLSKRLIELHEGHVIISSKLAQGSLFSVILPKKTRKRKG